MSNPNHKMSDAKAIAYSQSKFKKIDRQKKSDNKNSNINFSVTISSSQSVSPYCLSNLSDDLSNIIFDMRVSKSNFSAQQYGR